MKYLFLLTALFMFGCIDVVKIKSPEVYKFSEVPQLDVCITDIKLIFADMKIDEKTRKINFTGMNRYSVSANSTTFYYVDMTYLENITTDIKKMFKFKNAFKEDNCKITYEGILTISKFRFERALFQFEAEFKLVGIENGKDYYSFKETRGIIWEDYCTKEIPCDPPITKKSTNETAEGTAAFSNKDIKQYIINFANTSLQKLSKDFANSLKVDIFNKLGNNKFRTKQGKILDENGVEVTAKTILKGIEENKQVVKEEQKETVSTTKRDEKFPVMLKIIKEDFKLSETTLDLLRSGFEDTLTEFDYSLISEKAQEEALKEQAQQRKKECYDEECIVDVGKMIAARYLCLVDLKKTAEGENYIFQIKFIDIESGETIKSKTSIYSENISKLDRLLSFSKELITKLLEQ